MPKLLEDSFIAGVDEFWLGETADTRLASDTKLHQLVEKIGNRLTRENGFRRLTYHVVESKEANAFVTPGSWGQTAVVFFFFDFRSFLLCKLAFRDFFHLLLVFVKPK